jgi:hypothetical protein
VKAHSIPGLALAVLLAPWCVLGDGPQIVSLSHAKSGPGNGRSGYTKAISSQADLAKVIAQLQQPHTRFQAFFDLLEFAGWPQGNSQVDDPALNQMHAEAMQAMQGCPDVDGTVATMIQRLDEPKHRLEMIPALLEFAGPELQMGSVFFVSDNPKLDALKDKARQAVGRAADVKTVTRALASPNLRLRQWAVRNFANPLGRTEDWTPLLPQIEKAASGGESSLRQEAVGPLANFPGTEKFLDERFAIEKSPFILMGLLHRKDLYGESFDARFLPRFLPLLSDPDESVRDEALDFIGCTSIWAEMLRIPFGRDVFDKVVQATRAQSAKERFEAVFALDCIRHLDPDLSRQALIRLVNDPDAEVRWRLGFCLADQYDRSDVKLAIAALVKDKSPLVRFETIVAIGAEKFLPQLQELARGPDAQVAESASEKLKQIAERSVANETPLR